MISPVLKLFEGDETNSNFYLLLLLGSHIGLLIPPNQASRHLSSDWPLTRISAFRAPLIFGKIHFLEQ